MEYVAEMLGTGIYIIILLQVFNWFPGRLIHQVMAFWTMTQALGYITWICGDKNSNWIKCYIVAPIFILFAVLDFFYFKMYPSQVNIFVEDSKSQKKEK